MRAISGQTGCDRLTPGSSGDVLRRVIVVGVFTLLWQGMPCTQALAKNVDIRSPPLEVGKLEIELTGQEQRISWGQLLVGVALGGLSICGAAFIARQDRDGNRTQAVHEKRINCYPNLVKATSPLALYFPKNLPWGKPTIGPDDCISIGQAMSNWYFEEGGIFLSAKARDAYFLLARALTRASQVSGLDVPRFPEDASLISKENICQYYKTIARDRGLPENKAELNYEHVEGWAFGPPKSAEDSTETKSGAKFKDYVLLQQLSSQLRTCLAEDLNTRRPP